jgi:hypothetical protein
MKHDLRHKKHNDIIKNYNSQKEKHLEKLATKMLKNDEKSNDLKQYCMDNNFLKLF